MKLLTDLSRVDGVVKMPLSDVKRRSVGLAPGFDGSGTKFLQIEMATEVHPAHGARVAKKDFVCWHLQERVPDHNLANRSMEGYVEVVHLFPCVRIQ